MTAVSPLLRPARRAPHTVELAGVPWPVYKLEALALGVLMGLILGLVVGSVQTAVLAAAAIAALRWMVGAAGRNRPRRS